jgi:hypothetical protein
MLSDLYCKVWRQSRESTRGTTLAPIHPLANRVMQSKNSSTPHNVKSSLT